MLLVVGLEEGSTEDFEGIIRCKVRWGKLPLVFCIQANNCGRENKNIYVLGLCATLVVLGFL